MKRQEQLLPLKDELKEYIEKRFREVQYLDVNEAAEFLKISTSHLYRLVNERKIRHYKPNGKRIYFKMMDLCAFIESVVVRSERETILNATKVTTRLNRKYSGR